MKRWTLAALLTVTGCATDFTPAWEVIEPRPFGSKVFIEEDSEGRTRPKPGESFGFTRYFISPQRPQASYTMDAVACIGVQLPTGDPACFEQLELELSMDPYADDDQLTMRGLTIPREVEALPASLVDRVFFFGGACVDGEVERVPDKDVVNDSAVDVFRCTDNEDAAFPDLITFVTSLYLDLGDRRPNHHPSLACDPAQAGGACNEGVPHPDEDQVAGAIVLARPEGDDGYEPETWPAWDEEEQGPLPWGDCAGVDGLPQVRRESGEHLVRIRFDPSDRESFEEVLEGTSGAPVERREDLVVSHAITERGGELSSQKSLLDRAVPDDEAEIELSYFPGDEPDASDEKTPESGRLVRFYFALRDLRGGYDFTTRELCLLPPTP